MQTLQTLKQPESLSQQRIAYLESRRIDPKVASIDLEMVKMKMREPAEDLHWSTDQIEDAEVEYKRYLTLCILFPYPKHSIVPNKIMDTMWHYHIMDTKAYHRDCNRVFGHYFHHFPYFGLRGEEDAENLKQSFEQTKSFYMVTFGEPIDHASDSGDCWHDCDNRCWHACAGGGGGDDDDQGHSPSMYAISTFSGRNRLAQ